MQVSRSAQQQKKEGHSCHLCVGAHPTFLCPRARCNGGKGAPNWAVHEKQRARDEKRTPSSEGHPTTAVAASTTTMDASAAAADTSAAAAAAAPPPQSTHKQQVHLPWRLQVDHRSRWIFPAQHRWRRPLASPHRWDKRPLALAINWSAEAMQTCHEEHIPDPGNFIGGNLWNLNLRAPALEQAGPVGSFIRHTTSMAIPNFPRYARTGQWPVRSLRDLNTFPSIENAMAHQRYFEQLSFEARSLHQWSRMITERINDEREMAHNNLAGILESLSSAHQVHAWTRPQFAPALSMGPRAPLQGIAPPPQKPQMVQAQPPSQTLQVKPAPIPRSTVARSSTSLDVRVPRQAAAECIWAPLWSLFAARSQALFARKVTLVCVIKAH